MRYSDPLPPGRGTEEPQRPWKLREKKKMRGGNQDPVKDPGLFYRGGGEGRSTKRRLSFRLHVWLWKP